MFTPSIPFTFYFNPRPPRRGRLNCTPQRYSKFIFQPTPPAQGATVGLPLAGPARGDFNPRPPRRGRLLKNQNMMIMAKISTHAPRAGGDSCSWVMQLMGVTISTHAPRAGGDVLICIVPSSISSISTHAPRAGGDPSHPAPTFRPAEYFNPRPPRRGRPLIQGSLSDGQRDFNPRPPRRGRPGAYWRPHMGTRDFNPRPPRRGRLQEVIMPAVCLMISTHAPRAGGDWFVYR